MPLWLILLCGLCGAACRRTPPPIAAPVSGQIAIDGLRAPVRVVRDRWGVPHIYAESQADLFIAQGFVQAEDRLFQMDLWRRSVQGRLSQVLGPNFIQRDIMTQRIQYRGDRDADWASYGPDTRAIAEAFVRGINAWVAVARAGPADEFRLAGWLPEFWSASDLLNRTDAFLASGDAIDEVERRDMSFQIADVLRRVGTRPFVIGLEGRLDGSADDQKSPTPPVSREVELAQRRPRSASKVSMAPGAALAFTESGDLFEHPSRRYLVHLHAPGWNVIGATRPWLPGVAVGHNDHVAWGMAPYDADTQDIYQEPLDAPGRTTIRSSVLVSHRRTPLPYEWDLAPRGGVIAIDSEQKLAFVLQWSGSEPGTAAELGALAIDRAGTADTFRSALAEWKMPPREVVYADTAGNVASQAAGLVPIRRNGAWQGWMTLDELPHTSAAPNALSFESGPEHLDAYPSALFAHLLGINPAARRRFNVGPITRPAGDDGAVRGVMDPADWDRSRALVAPGQSESPASPHFADLAALWSRGEQFPLVFSDADVDANMQSTLTLIPSAGGAK